MKKFVLKQGSGQGMNKIHFQEEGHLYFNERGVKVPCVSDILAHFGFSDFSFVNPEVLKAAQDFGSNVHATTHLYDIDDLAECDPQVEPYLDGWIKFKAAYGFDEFEVIEEPMYSKVWGFAGMPDRVFKDILPDIKTGSQMVHHKIQTAFYQILVEENYKIKIRKRLSVYLRENKYFTDFHKDRTDINIAKSLASIYNFKRKEKLL